MNVIVQFLHESHDPRYFFLSFFVRSGFSGKDGFMIMQIPQMRPKAIGYTTTNAMKESGESPKRSGMIFTHKSQVPTQRKMVMKVAAVCIKPLTDLIFFGHIL